MQNVVRIDEEEDEDIFTELVAPKNLLIKEQLEVVGEETNNFISFKEKFPKACF